MSDRNILPEELKKLISDKLDFISFLIDWMAPSELNLENIDDGILEIRPVPCSKNGHSLRLYSANGNYKCNICDRQVDIFNLFAMLFRVSDNNSFYALAKEANVDISKLNWIRTKYTTFYPNYWFEIPNYGIHFPIKTVYFESGWFKGEITPYHYYYPQLGYDYNYGDTDEYEALCPLNENKRRHHLFLYLDNGDYHCHECGKQGSMINFYQNRFNADYETACRELCKYVRPSYRRFKRNQILYNINEKYHNEIREREYKSVLDLFD